MSWNSQINPIGRVNLPRSTNRRQCPKCGRENALARYRLNRASTSIVQCQWCDYKKVSDRQLSPELIESEDNSDDACQN